LVKQRAGHWVAVQVEEAKIALSEHPAARIDLSRVAPDLGVDVTRASFDACVSRLIEKVEITVGALLRDAGVATADVDTVFFTGGSSRVPRLRETVSALVPGARSVEGDLFQRIGAGLA
ncbi:MAG TPA: heat-shock protein, partial [Achromobacter sp.]|nr:heat-shock protein [Achromobacter sp.]